MKRVNISLRKDVHSQAKIICILKNVHLNKYLELCIEKAIKEDQKILQVLKIENNFFKIEKNPIEIEKSSNKEEG
ncbi:MAG: hypothetical protein AABW48_03355 [Nanoarchaeota archaeon]